MEWFDIAQGLAASAGAGAIGAFGWIVSRLWSLWRHEVRDMKQAISSNTVALTSFASELMAHMRADETTQNQISQDLSEIKGYLRGQGGQPLGG